MRAALDTFARAVNALGGKSYLVGGAVRDLAFGVEPKDLDVEVFGLDPDALARALDASFHHVLHVGRSFPVWKAWNDDMSQADAFDIALPRREVKTGPHHTDFAITFDPFMSFTDAASRRDFTMNAMGLDLITGERLDPFNGMADIASRTLRHTSGHFVEDPLRVLRGMQFCARFGLIATEETLDLCAALSQDGISAERLMGEWSKLILKGVHPSLGLTFLYEADWLRFYPELLAIVGVSQSPVFHPEGDVFSHIRHCMDAFAARRIGDDTEDLVLGFATLLHDLGKATTTVYRDGDWRSPEHEPAGVEPATAFMRRLTNETVLIDDVNALVLNHMAAKLFYKEADGGTSMDRAIRRLSTRVRLDRLARITAIDQAGRPPLPPDDPSVPWLLERAAALDVKSRQPIRLLQGRDLIALGLTPGPDFKSILTAAYELQLDGTITSHEEAVRWARERLDKGAGE